MGGNLGLSLSFSLSFSLCFTLTLFQCILFMLGMFIIAGNCRAVLISTIMMALPIKQNQFA